MFYDSHLSTLMRLSCANLNFSHLTFFIYFWVAIPSFPLNRKHLFGCQLALLMGSMMLLRRNNKTKRKHKCWIRGIFLRRRKNSSNPTFVFPGIFLRRREHGQFYALFQELKFDGRTLHHTTHHVRFFFFCKMAPSTCFESDRTLHNTCFKVNDRSSQTHVSVGSVVMVGKVELDSSVADHCSRRGQMFPRVCDVAQTHRWVADRSIMWKPVPLVARPRQSRANKRAGSKCWLIWPIMLWGATVQGESTWRPQLIWKEMWSKWR